MAGLETNMVQKRARSKHINNLPPQWEWRYEGEQSWITSQGKESVERHGYNTQSGEKISVRQVQNLQRIEKQKLGVPTSPVIRREGRRRTIKQKTLRRRYEESIKTGKKYGNLYDPDIHGNVEAYSFDSLYDARTYVAQNGLPDFGFAMLSIKYTKRLTNPPGKSDQRMRNGYSTLSGFVDVAILEVGASVDTDVIPGTLIDNPWFEALDNIVQNFDMSGSGAKFYITVFER
jgi:hypothetical protein